MRDIIELVLFVAAFIAAVTAIGCAVDYYRIKKRIAELEAELTPEELEEVNKPES